MSAFFWEDRSMNTTRASLAVLLLLGSSVAALADEVRGVITRVDPEKKVLEIETRGRRVRRTSMTFDIGKDTAVTVGRQQGDPGSLQAGDRVTVFFDSHDGKRVATQIRTLGLRLWAGTNPATGNPENMVAGTLAHVEAKDREIIIMSPDPSGEGHSEVKLKVDESAHVSRDQKPASLEDLKEGDHVLVRTNDGQEKRTALDIQAGKFSLPADVAASRRERLERIFEAADRILRQINGPPPPPNPDK
jgi:Cu/Ag efflux protein CusF